MQNCARRHDAGLWQCMCADIDLWGQEDTIWETATLSMSLGGLGLPNTLKLRVPAFWANWTDCLPKIERDPTVVQQLMVELEGYPDTPPRDSCKSVKSRTLWKSGLAAQGGNKRLRPGSRNSAVKFFSRVDDV